MTQMLVALSYLFNLIMKTVRYFMPLKKESTNNIISSNISEMVKAGYPQEQAIAASLSKAKKKKPVVRKKAKK